MQLRRLAATASILILGACGGGRADDDDGSLFTEGGPGGGPASAEGSGSGDGDGDGEGSGDGDGETTGGTEEGGVFDVGNSSGATAEGGCDPNNDPECSGCTAVDIVFVIDNSVSMNDYQVALGLAFPAFADAIVAALPPGTDVHVGVTSTEMGYSSSGSTSNCQATGDNGQPASAFYITPDQQKTAKNGAQGRLYQYGGKSFVAFDTDAPAQEIQAAKDWFKGASNIGEGGSQIEMSAAGAGWVFSPANGVENAGFVRDEGAVLVIFVLQDEPDQTPGSATQEIIDMITAAKQGCGGMDCVIGGGFVDQFCLGQTPLGGLFGAFGAPAVEMALPDENLAEDDPQAAADMMTGLLEDTLAQVIAQKCDEIPPEG